MGWSADLISTKEIKEHDIDVFVSQLPLEFSSPLPWGNSKQSWGWSTAVDITLTSENAICLSGSYGISGHIAEKYTNYIKDYLEKTGYDIQMIEHW